MLDMLQAYFLELKNVKPATEEEIGKLWAKIKKQDKKAMKRMVEINYCLVIPIAKKFIRRGVDLMDLIADGNLGLMKAVEKFDPEKNIKFSTYATYWIEQYIRKSIEDNSKTVRIPSYMYEIMSKWKRVRNTLIAKLHREPTVEQIAKELDIPIDKAEEINYTLFSFDSISSLDMAMFEDSDSLKKDNIKDNLLKTPESVTEIIRTSKNVQQAIDMLPEREAEIIKMRFGINNIRNLSLEEIGNKYGVSKERVRQLEFKALQRLKYVFLKLKYIDSKTVDTLILDQRGTQPDRRQNSDPSFKERRKADRRKAWI